MIDVRMNLKEDDYRINEAFKSLRTNIEFTGVENKVIAITSCTPSEGKSTVSLLLAKSLMEIGKRVLLIDADLRKSVMIGKHHVGRDIKGLSHYLSGQANFDEILCKTQKQNLHTIFAGPVPPNPSELLGNQRFKTLIARIKDDYDYILVDTPPLGSVIDSAIVSKFCDAAIFVLESGAISHKFAKTVKDQLKKSNPNILGVVLNKVDFKGDRFFGKYYGKYYGN